MAGAGASGAVDARLYDDVVWILRRYHLRVSAAREAGHHTHGDGTAVDLVPADGTTQAVWDASAGRLAHDLGWTPACARSGTRPACRLAPAIQFIGYDGYPSHGSPRTCGGACPAHLHLSWASPCYGTSSPSPPCEWVMAFTVLPTAIPTAGRPGSARYSNSTVPTAASSTPDVVGTLRSVFARRARQTPPRHGGATERTCASPCLSPPGRRRSTRPPRRTLAPWR
jgi:hypothetical protein